MLRASTTQVVIGTQINWPTDSTTVADVVIGREKFSAFKVDGSALTEDPPSVSGVVNLTGYSSVRVYLITKSAAVNGGAVQYQESPDGVNWTAAANFSSGALTSTAAGTQVRTLSNVKYVKFTMAIAGGATDELTANVVVYAV